MDEIKSYYDDLITRYFLGEATPEEISGLSDWLSRDPLNIKLFDEYRQTWLLTVNDAVSSSIDIDKEWSELISRIDHPSSASSATRSLRKKSPIFSLSTSWKVAASIIMLAVIAAVFYYTTLTPNMVEVYAENSNLEQILPDGSVVTLYKGSIIEYPAEFQKKERSVILEGEAFFRVTPDSSLPFVVSGNDVRIKVLGTSFNVNTREDKNMVSVVLATGKVSLFFKQDESEQLILNPGEKALIHLDKKSMQKSANSDPNYNAWMTGNITFNNTNLKEVIATLEKVYQTKIILSNGVSDDCTLTATFNQQSFEEVMQVIGMTLDLQITSKDNITTIDGACN